MSMRKIIFLLMSIFSMAASADDKLNGGFIVAPILAENYAAYGDCLAPNEMIGEDIGCVTCTYVTIINAQTATGIKNIKKEGDKVNYRLQGNVLKVYTSAMLYSLEGKLICGLKGEQQIDTSVLPDGFILKFEDGTVCKLLK